MTSLLIRICIGYALHRASHIMVEAIKVGAQDKWRELLVRAIELKDDER